MMQLKDIRGNLALINDIDWEMGPEDAVTMYLEWGNNPVLGNNKIRSKNDYSTYFVVNTWKKPVVYLIRRNSQDAEELAEIPIPADLATRFLDSVGNNKGVYAVDGEVRDWLKRQLNVD